MAFSFKRIFEGLKLVPKSASTSTSSGQLEVLSADGKLLYNNQNDSNAGASAVVTEVHGAQGANRLQNKDLADTSVIVVNNSDVSKQLKFDVSGSATNQITLLKTSTSGGDKTITLPNATDTLVGKATTDTLTNKTLTSPVINTPTGITKSDVGLGNVDNTSDATKNAASVTLTNKTIDTAGGNVLKVNGNTLAATAGTATVTVPNSTDTLVGRNTTDTLTNKTLSGNTATNLVSGSGTLTLNTTGTITVPNATDTLVGKATTDILTNKTLTAPVISTISNTGTLTLPTSSDTLVGRATTDTLSNKTFSDAQTLTEIATPSSPSSGSLKLYSKTDDSLYILNSAGTETKLGAGSGGINYITNSDAESNTTGYTVVANTTPGSLPTVAQAGTPASGFTFTRSTSSPLRGTANFLITKPAINSQGTMVKYPFTIAAADKAKMLQINAEYNIASGTYVDGDTTLYIQDVTNGTIIQPAGYQIMNAGSTINPRITATFQSAVDSVSYALLIYVASTSASAYTIKLDDISVGPVVTTQSTFVGEWTQATDFTFNNFGNGTGTVFTRRIGGSVDVRFSYLVGSTLPSGSLSITTPSRLTLDTSRVAGGDFLTVTGLVNLRAGGSNASYAGIANINSTNTIAMYGVNGGGGWTGTNPTTPTASSGVYSGEITYPVVGWSSSQITSDQSSEGRVVAMYAVSQNPTGTMNASVNIVKFGTIAKDSHGAYDTSTGLYTVKVPGWYSCTATLDITAASASVGNFQITLLLKNGSVFASGNGIVSSTGAVEHSSCASGLVYCVAGDTIGVYSQTNKTTPAFTSNLGGSSVSINRVSGNEQVLASESVNATYYNTSASSYPTVETAINFDTKEFDSHNAVTTGAGWLFTAPVSGKYLVSVQSSSSNITVEGVATITVYKNNSTLVAYGRVIKSASTASGVLQPKITKIMSLNAGDTLQVRTVANTGTFNYDGGQSSIFFSIAKVGN